MKRLAALFLLVAVAAAPLRADDAAAKATVKKLVGEATQATMKGDYAKVIDMTHPAAVTAMGGREKAIETVTNLMNQIKSQGFVIDSMVAEEPGDLVVDGKTSYVIIPSKTEMTFPQGKIKVNSYFLGVSPDAGATWTFLDGSGLGDKNFRDQVIPNLPATVKLPAPQQPEVILKK